MVERDGAYGKVTIRDDEDVGGGRLWVLGELSRGDNLKRSLKRKAYRIHLTYIVGSMAESNTIGFHRYTISKQDHPRSRWSRVGVR